MVHFTHLKANIKAATELELEPCTCIVGANTAGKSSVLDTIRLALTGKHPIGGHPSDLAQLAAEPNPDKIFASLTGPKGSVGWVMSFEEGKPKKPKPPRRTGIFETFTEATIQQCLVLDHRTTLAFGAERMRRAVMTRFGELAAIRAPRGLNAAQQAAWDRAAMQTDGGEPSEQLVALEKHFKTEARIFGDQAKTKENLLESMRAQTQDKSNPELLSQLLKRIDKLEQYQIANEKIDRAQRLQRNVSQLQDQIDEQPRIDTAALDGEIGNLKQSIGIAESLLLLLKRAQTETCPCCGATEFDPEALKQNVEERLSIRQNELSDAESRRKTLLAGQSVDVLTQQIDRAKVELSLLDDFVGRQFEDTSELPNLRQQVIALKHAELTRKNLAVEEANLHNLLDEQATAKLLGQQVSSMLRNYLQTVQAKAEEAVNKFMPSGFRATLHLADNACEWKMVGADGRPHSAGAYSGSEGGSLLIAMAQAWAEGAPYRLVLLDDVDLGVFDPKNLRNVFAKFKESVEAGHLDQVVMVWNRPDEVPPDWHKISL